MKPLVWLFPDKHHREWLIDIFKAYLIAFILVYILMGLFLGLLDGYSKGHCEIKSISAYLNLPYRYACEIARPRW